jgi:transaldolase
MVLEKIEIYYDGVNIQQNCGPEIKGFTTNITFLKNAGITNYNAFITNSLLYSNKRPISFQIYEELDIEIENISKRIQAFDSSIFVKIPIIKSNGETNANIIKKLHQQHIQINVTAIFTKEQIDTIKECFNKDTNVIISIFGGRINDLGLDCSDIVKYAVDSFKEYNNVKILWAACRTIYNIIEAEQQGAHIVTVPEVVLSKISSMNKSLEQASIDTVTTFKNDGINGNIHLWHVHNDF